MAKQTHGALVPVNGPDGSIQWQQWEYGELVQHLNNDLDLSANDTITTTSFTPVWTTVTYQNAWATAGTPAAYWKDPHGFVHLRGRISGGATGTVAFTLPVGYRPSDPNSTIPAAGWSGASPGAALLFFGSAGPGQCFVYYAAGFTDVGFKTIFPAEL